MKNNNSLFFALAYPENKEAFLQAELKLKKIASKKEKKKNQLVFSPSFDLLKRMNELFPEKISIHSSSAEKEKISSVFKILLPVAEQETIDKKDLSFTQRVKQLKKTRRGEIGWLINLFENRFGDEFLIDNFFNSLEIYFSIPLSSSTFSQETLRSLYYEPHFHQALLKKVNAAEILDEELNRPISLSSQEKISLADTSRLALIFLGRETDPSTYANVNDIEWHNM